MRNFIFGLIFAWYSLPTIASQDLEPLPVPTILSYDYEETIKFCRHLLQAINKVANNGENTEDCKQLIKTTFPDLGNLFQDLGILIEFHSNKNLGLLYMTQATILLLLFSNHNGYYSLQTKPDIQYLINQADESANLKADPTIQQPIDNLRLACMQLLNNIEESQNKRSIRLLLIKKWMLITGKRAAVAKFLIEECTNTKAIYPNLSDGIKKLAEEAERAKSPFYSPI